MNPTFLSLLWKTAVVHTVTYTGVGLVALTVLDYRTIWTLPHVAAVMRPIDDPMVMAGPLFQPIRGVLFGVVFYLLREPCFGKSNGWLVLWGMLVIVGILSTFGPAPGSLEGLVYTTWPVGLQLFLLPEVVVQALLLSIILSSWVASPARWITWTLHTAFVLAIAGPIAGLLVGAE